MKVFCSDENVQVSPPRSIDGQSHRIELNGATDTGRIEFDFRLESEVDEFPFAFGARPFQVWSNPVRPTGVGHAVMVVESIDVARGHWPKNEEVTPPEIPGWSTRIIVKVKAIYRNTPPENEVYTLWESQLPLYNRTGMHVGLWLDFNVTPIDFGIAHSSETR